MQVNTFSNIASMAQTQVSNKKADDAKENTKDKMFKVLILARM